ncbi:ATP-binding protein [Actinomadura adrarensis]|uniref:ATP-binding protein n=1 Tax=Actinomadura adrarensis TaxID=1819600 RepID=A0ABW3CAK2_9ACTN
MENATLAGATAADWLWSPPKMRWRRVYPGRIDQVRQARDFAETLFKGAPCVDVVALAVSELAANAVRHTLSGERVDGWFGLEVVYDNPAYIAVTDMGGHGIPTVLPEGYGSPYNESGRGLRTLYELAQVFGVHGNSTHGHTVWVHLDANRKLEADLEAFVRSVS